MHPTFHTLLKNIVVSQRIQKMEIILFVHELSINRTNFQKQISENQTLDAKMKSYFGTTPIYCLKPQDFVHDYLTHWCGAPISEVLWSRR